MKWTSFYRILTITLKRHVTVLQSMWQSANLSVVDTLKFGCFRFKWVFTCLTPSGSGASSASHWCLSPFLAHLEGFFGPHRHDNQSGCRSSIQVSELVFFLSVSLFTVFLPVRCSHMFLCVCVSPGETGRRQVSRSTWKVSGQEARGWIKLGKACCRCGRDRFSSSTESVQTWLLPSWLLILHHSCSRRYTHISQTYSWIQSWKEYSRSVCLLVFSKPYTHTLAFSVQPGQVWRPEQIWHRAQI